MKKAVDIDYAPVTINRYINVMNKLKKAIPDFYKKEDITFFELNSDFISAFDLHLKTEAGLYRNTIVRYMKCFKRITNMALAKEWMHKDPFYGYKMAQDETDPIFLTYPELKSIMEKKFTIPRLELVRDIFVFACYTGLAYADIKQLHPRHIETTADGRRFIRINRKKTGVEAVIPLHPIAEQILALYNTTDMHNLVFPLPSRDSIWHEIREISVILGRNDDLSYHQGRHGFGVLFISESIAIESIAKMMGHSNITTTQGYARITEDKISKEMDKLMEKRSKSRAHSGHDNQ